MESFTPELIEKARDAKSAEELLALAQENNIEDFTLESAKAYFDLLHPATGEVSDEELANVSGGGCYNKGELVVTNITHACSEYICKYCGRNYAETKSVSQYALGRGWMHASVCEGVGKNRNTQLECGYCKYIKYERGLWLCSNPKKRK